MHKWYVVQVMSSHEKKVKKAIEEFLSKKGLAEDIVEILVPTENISEVKRGQQKISEKRMWPGYLLVRMHLTDDTWAYIKDTPGVIDFLGGEKPTSLTEKEVNDIMQELQDREKGVVQKHKVDVGDRVKITDGVFVNFVGVVTEVNHEKGRLSVMVSIFGRDTRVDDLEFWQVEQATAENTG
ncbi:MAG: transcription termination/antitermination protein NusG [Chlamydiae bacterium RIFCSPHIGHO2_12_FULL_44_59]|nr:MAG: transcription termination/antitermination protein NusG [Chlamydiae bacterium RIFCSPHIGHO2_01_FULL_44_39]OGN57102.1 MAG: transcription termination/antitermination protein NusG [Chlamydiae bacterium RIFCSPHIGHO2_02_FULL_45_9]OGN60784.1 MAG: transcription termination/antitermination protein NusG [Chlamydiae bacterium RIFCSPHIGHO2_12_FULL_44_59]OGN67043.1 MAG: transcription termination/antitermination protein NusG [Chlamydiae bacterium RIFCSPLOWO2_01_FULL_44_52]OGN67542.1 MAG: transcription